MLNKKHLLALAAAALLAGCGGGDNPAPAHEAAATALRAHTLSVKAASAVAPDEAARQLMDYAEARSDLKVYFPSHQATQDFGPFKFRYYPTSGIYLGVVVTADPNYILNGVYVMGGEFGNNPIYVGKVTDYIVPTDPNTNPTGGNNGCADLTLAEVQGTRLVINYAYSGVITGNVTSDTLVGGLTTFEGQQAREVTTKTAGTTTTSGLTAEMEIETKAYERKTGDAEVTNYGMVSVSKSKFGGIDSITTIKSVWSPPWVDRQYALALGGTLTVTQTGTTTTTTSFGGLPGTPMTSPSSLTETVKYVARESVTVPAGTYTACKYEHTSAGSAGGADVTTNWLIVGKGIPVKTVSGSGSNMLTIQATSITLNGQAI